MSLLLLLKSGTAPPGGTPTRVGTAYTANGQSDTVVTVTPDGTIATGHWMILVATMVSTTTVSVSPAGWTTLQAPTSAGTLKVGIYGKLREAGDTGYTYEVNTGGVSASATLMWGSGADAVSTWLVGTNGFRTVDKTNTAPSVTTVADRSLALIVSTERTTATETGITSITGAAEWFFGAQAGSMIQTTHIGYIANVTPVGATGDVTIVYPNTQSVNGFARQIILPPGPGGPATTGELSSLISLTAVALTRSIVTAQMVVTSDVSAVAETVIAGAPSITSGATGVNTELTAAAVTVLTSVGNVAATISVDGAATTRAQSTGAAGVSVVLAGTASQGVTATGAVSVAVTLTGRGLMGTFWDGTALRTGEIYYWSGTARSELTITDLQVMT